MTWTGANAQQVSYIPAYDIPVTGASGPLGLAWSGGLDAPQVNTIDLDADGTDEFVLFERISFTISVYSPTENGWEPRPELAALLPAGLEHWVLLRDFNGDGKKDIFTSSPLGMKVYVNVSVEEDIRWRLYHSREPGPSPLMTTGFNGTINLQVNATDIPNISDIDDDGDLDILVFRFTGTSSVEWHRNMAMERTGRPDSMQLVRETQRWANFTECNCGEFAFQGTECAPQSGKVLHEGGKSLLILDWDGDGDKDALVSEETCDQLYLLENEGGEMVRSTVVSREDIPFPAAYLEDSDLDGTPDLILASNLNSSTEAERDFSRTLLAYPDVGGGPAPEFTITPMRFLQEEMIDVGSGAAPALFDIDQDGDADLFIGNRYTFFDDPPAGSIYFFENTGSREAPEFRFDTNDFLGLSSLALHTIQPVFRDVSGDGRSDLVILADNEEGERRLYAFLREQNGFSETPFVLFNDFSALDAFALQDVNQDNVPDLLITRVTGRVEYYSGSYSENDLLFTLDKLDFLGLTNDPFRSRGRLILEDINGNGRLDAVHTFGRGSIYWSPDVDISGTPVFERLDVGVPEPLDLFGNYLWLVPAGIFNESIPSMLAGTGRGGLLLFRADDVTTVEEEFLVYPNPVVSSENRLLKVRSERILELSLVNMLGQVVREYGAIPPGLHSISLDGLTAGVYIVVGRQNGEVVVSRRVMILD